MVNTNKLKGRIKEKGLTQADLASFLGIAPATMCQKINNIRPMDLSEAQKLCEILDIQSDDFGAYFFASCVA